MKKLIFAVTALALSTAQAGVVIHVDVANCPAPGNGSEAEPYCSIQTAIDNAVDTDEIVVAPGTYFEVINFNGKAITVRSADPLDPAVVAATVIDGTGLNDSVVKCVSGEGSGTVLSGLTITGGTGTDPFPGSGFTYGGGMFIHSDPTVTNCTFTGNTAYFGGGLFNDNGSQPMVSGCVFSGNTADRGGGIYNFEDSIPAITNCTFSGNTAANSGGGMSNVFGSPIVVNCTFIGNAATYAGAMFNAQAGPTVTNCTFIGNWAANSGGGLYLFSVSHPTVTNCTFSANSAVNGKAVALDSGSQPFPSDLTMTNCILWNGGDEIWNNDGSTVTINYSDVQDSWPGIGNIAIDPLFDDPNNGDYRLSSASPCIDAGDNTAVPLDITTDLNGNPRFLEIPETPDTGKWTLPIVDMGAYESLGGGCLAVTNQEVVCHADGSTFTVNIEGLNACTGGTTQVTFTASGGSVGEELCFTALVNDGGFCCSTEICVTIPDCTPAALPSDLDGDGIVGIADFLALLAAWGSCPDCGSCPADFDGNCSVGILDLLILLGNWS